MKYLHTAHKTKTMFCDVADLILQKGHVVHMIKMTENILKNTIFNSIPVVWYKESNLKFSLITISSVFSKLVTVVFMEFCKQLQPVFDRICEHCLKKDTLSLSWLAKETLKHWNKETVFNFMSCKSSICYITSVVWRKVFLMLLLMNGIPTPIPFILLAQFPPAFATFRTKKKKRSKKCQHVNKEL